MCNNIGVWQYMPGKGDEFYCEEHVPRGCPCNEDQDGNQILDECGREYPCCEYNYYENGVEF